MKEEVIEIIISELDFYLIEKVRELRVTSNPYISQLALSQKLEVSEGYISKVENLREKAKYNIWLINRLVKIFQLKSYSELFPKDIIQNDIVRIRLKLLKNTKGKQVIDDIGNLNKSYEIISINPLNEEELELWKLNRLDYKTIVI